MGMRRRKHLLAVCVCLGLAVGVGPLLTAVAHAQAQPAAASPPVPIAATASGQSPPLVPISYAPPRPPLPAASAPGGSLPPLVRIVPSAPHTDLSPEPRSIASLPVSPAAPVARPAIIPLPLPAATPAPGPVAPLRITPLPVPPAVAAVTPLPPQLPAAIPLPVAPQPAAGSPIIAPAVPAVAPQQASLPPQQQALPPQASLPPQAAPPQPPPPQAPAAVPAPAAAAAGKPADAITIASFNIQVFGESKIAKPQVVDVLARVVRGCDIVAIQEVRAKSDHVIPQFLDAVNADGSRYQFVIGPRLGRTASKEQYVFIYDTTRIEIDPTSVGTAPNPGDRLHRPPMFARFRVRTNPPESGFSFWLVDIHTDPDEVPQEVDALADVFVAMRAARPDEDDVILLGDLNAGPPQFGRLGQIPGIGWAVSGVTTNTRRTKTYDNIIFDRTATSEYTGRWGVLDLQNTFGLTLDQALVVSDHNPVWACFRPWETQRTGSLPAAAQPQ
jgi:deoxyribonuclease-1-like protein